MAQKWKILNGFAANDRCAFCNRNTNDEFNFGKIYQSADLKVHYFCLLFATHLRQNGKDTEGLLGFLVADVHQELKKNSRIVCHYCRTPGAACSCGMQKCHINFHFACGLENNSFHTFFGQFRSFCSEHTRKPPVPLLKNADEDEIICVICMENFENIPHSNIIYASCCNNICFHKQCIQKMALSAGYFFKCPNCNNKKNFRQSMLKNGIYIPDIDAAWESSPNYFSGLYVQYQFCDMSNCLCPFGRSHSDPSGSWRIIRCNTCGSQGTHRECGKNSIYRQDWTCTICCGIGSSGNNEENDAPKNRFGEPAANKQNKMVTPGRTSFCRVQNRRKSGRISKICPAHGLKSAENFKLEKRVRYVIDNTSVYVLPSCKNQLKQMKIVLSPINKSL